MPTPPLADLQFLLVTQRDVSAGVRGARESVAAAALYVPTSPSSLKT